MHAHVCSGCHINYLHTCDVHDCECVSSFPSSVRHITCAHFLTIISARSMKLACSSKCAHGDVRTVTAESVASRSTFDGVSVTAVMVSFGSATESMCVPVTVKRMPPLKDQCDASQLETKELQQLYTSLTAIRRLSYYTEQ